MLRVLRPAGTRLLHTTTRALLGAAPGQPASAAAAAVARLKYDGDRPKLHLHLPGAAAGRAFTVNMARDLSHLLTQIEDEEKPAGGVGFVDVDGFRFARSTPLPDVLRPGATVEVNGQRYPLQLPTVEELSQPIVEGMQQMESELDKLHELKLVCDRAAQAHGNRLMWLGLVGLCAQWGLMMRLTWYEYSWDVMEPIAYFLSFGTGILGYIFYIATRKEYTFENLGGVTVTRRQRREYAKRGLDLGRYSDLQLSIQRAQEQLAFIREHRVRW
eukprot:Unigene7095_Nuclearia_a/m.21736 Unigene7095_Nuclearia_a/g.21736  ORF Unigene7095_Nuclearia_a/g.21736 Unigene7095_Nuclearia_a/m.21736 type:complete len:272 (-) Unigene7095_Nuclearia_a:92-907(-)